MGWYTKTATFLFPLTGVPKSIFSCNVKNTFNSSMFFTRFCNAYMTDSRVKHYKENHVFIVARAYRDRDFDSFYDTMLSLDNYVDDYEDDEYIVFIYKILPEYLPDYQLLLQGKYSEISSAAERVILSNYFFSNATAHTILRNVFNKSYELKDLWEKRLNANLNDQEVWGIIEPEKEKLCDKVMNDLAKHFREEDKKSIHKSRILKPNEEFGI